MPPKLSNRSLELHRYHEAAQALWDFFWREFCDWYLEVKKLRFRENSGVDEHWQAALTVYEAALRLLHPLMPFITEELWQRLIHNQSANARQPKSISLAAYPLAHSTEQTAGVRTFELFQEVVKAARELRADHKLDPKTTIEGSLYLRTSGFAAEDLAALGSLANLKLDQLRGTLNEHSGLIRSTPEFDLQLFAEAPAVSQNGASGDSRARIQKEIESLEKLIASSTRQLSDETFLSKAPEKVVASLRAKLADYQEQLAKNQKLLETLS